MRNGRAIRFGYSRGIIARERIDAARAMGLLRQKGRTNAAVVIGMRLSVMLVPARPQDVVDVQGGP